MGRWGDGGWGMGDGGIGDGDDGDDGGWGTVFARDVS